MAMQSQRRTRAQWAQIVNAYRGSGESQRAFCAEQGIGQSSLRYWIRRLREDSEDTQAGSPRAVAVQVIDAPAASPGEESGVRIRLDGGRHIEVRLGFDAGTLRRVVAALEGSP